MTVKYGTTWDDEDLSRAIGQAPQTYRGVMRPALGMMLQETRKELVRNSSGSAGGEGNLAASWQVLMGFGTGLEGSVRSAVPYAFYADQGRKPGKMPPYDPIEQWVHRMGLGGRVSGEQREKNRERSVKTGSRKTRTTRTDRSSRGTRSERGDLDRETIIYLIRRKIGKRGTYTPLEPPKFMEKSRRNILPRLERIHEDALNAFVAAVSTD